MDLKQRLNLVVQKDKQNNPKFLINIIKSDFYYLINNYFEVDFDDVEVDIETKDDNYIISIQCCGDRIKMMQTLPE